MQRHLQCSETLVPKMVGFCKLLSSAEWSIGEGTQCSCSTVCVSMVSVMLDPHSVLDT